jgi:orotidine-5'-phosphate decarboxylase
MTDNSTWGEVSQLITADTDPKDRLMIALDGSEKEVRQWARELQGQAGWVKCGMTLFYQTGPSIAAEMKNLGFKVFVDLKLHDIPHQIEGAARALGALGIDLITIHALGGKAMMEAAMRGVAAGAAEADCERPRVVAVTILTSTDAETAKSIGLEGSAVQQVERLARLAKEAGVDGIVCSAQEAPMAREILGQEAIIITPGVRPKGADAGDQSRILTPAAAFASGASHLVIGRPITQAANKKEACCAIIEEIEASI